MRNLRAQPAARQLEVAERVVIREELDRNRMFNPGNPEFECALERLGTTQARPGRHRSESSTSSGQSTRSRIHSFRTVPRTVVGSGAWRHSPDGPRNSRASQVYHMSTSGHKRKSPPRLVPRAISRKRLGWADFRPS